MATIKAFKGYRPQADQAGEIASRPYDVLDSDEARQEAEGHPLSFLHVVKPEIDCPIDMDPYDQRIYEKGSENFKTLVEKGVFKQDEKECIYLYRLTMDGRTQTGIVACALIDDYFDNTIKKHELTRPVKENDRMNHIRVSNLQAEPVFFTYRAHEELDRFIAELTSSHPLVDFVANDDIRHEFWVVEDDAAIAKIITCFDSIPNTYVADGHHRTAAGAKVGMERRESNPNHQGDESYNYFLAVHFPDTQLHIIDYNRVVRDLGDLDKASLIEKVGEQFEIEEKGSEAYHPEDIHHFGMYIEGVWYKLVAKKNIINDDDPIGGLDVSILSDNVLGPILDIHDLRNDKRIEFVGGIRGLGELEKLVDSGKMKVAFSLYPVTMAQLMNIADTDNIMPPKSTWFEPKLRSGLVVHSIED